jgi:hypothetical protein
MSALIGERSRLACGVAGDPEIGGWQRAPAGVAYADGAMAPDTLQFDQPGRARIQMPGRGRSRNW